MNKKRIVIVLSLVVVGAVAIIWIGWFLPWSGSGYIVEVEPADTANPENVTAFSALSEAQQQQFNRTLNRQRQYDSQPVLNDYAGAYIRYDGELYYVSIAVAN